MINKNVFTKTKNSLIKINILVVAGFLLIFSMYIYSYFKGLTNSGIDSKLQDELEYISTQLASNSFFNPMMLKDPRNMVYVYENNRIRYYTENRYFDGILPDTKDDKENEYFTYTENGYTFRELNITIGKYKIQIIRNIDSEVSSLKQLMFVLVIGIFVSMAITYFVAVYLTKKALTPIETAWANQEKFIQDASHELRTPIAIVSSKLEGLLKVPNSTVSDEVETIADAMKETRRLKKMISDLLSLTKEDSITKINLEKINLEELVHEISNNYSDIAEFQEKNFSISCELKNKNIITDKNKLRQLILIFIDNAFKYTSNGDSILIELREEKENSIGIYIKDSGVGIKKEDIPFIFDRFFRSDHVRNKDIEGSGIGLSIANMIIINLNGKVYVNSTLGEGSEFKIIIPNLYNKNI